MTSDMVAGSGSQKLPAMLRRLRLAIPAAAVLTALAVATPANAQPAGGGNKVKPNQSFGGQINGSSGFQRPAVIRMACLGPITPGETGHPMGGQTVGVFLAEGVGGKLGHTGPQTTSIGAFFGAPPPGAPSTTGFVDFTHYGTRALPTALTLPCAGNGAVIFVPLPTVPGGRSTTVPVRFVGQP